MSRRLMARRAGCHWWLVHQCFGCLLLALISACAAAVSSGAPPVYVPNLVRQNADPKLAVNVAQQSSRDGKEVTLTLTPAENEFTLELAFDDVRPRKLQLIVKGRGEPSRLEYTFRPKSEIDLLTTPGIEITNRGKDCTITLTRMAVEILPPGGKLHYVGPRPKTDEDLGKSPAKKSAKG